MTLQQRQQAEPGVLKLYSCIYDARHRFLYVNPFEQLESWAVAFTEGYDPPAVSKPFPHPDWYLAECEGCVTEVGEFGSPEIPLTRLLTVQKVVRMEKMD